MLAAAVVCVVVAFGSWVQAVAQPSNSSVGIRTVEWLRDHGARGLVNEVESVYYSLTAPSKGGPQLKTLPKQVALGVAPALRGHRTADFYRPPPIRPVLHPALPGEGVWRTTFAGGGAQPPVLITTFRSDPNYPRTVAGVAWIDHTRTSTWLYPGRQEPAVNLPSRGPMEVPSRLRPRLG